VKKQSSMPTVADVAGAAGVGAITVSRFVNGASYVSAAKKKTIQAATDKLGYRPNQAARILKGQRARVIGVILPDLADSFFGKCASAIESYASSRGYMTVIVPSKHDRNI
jgi:LacI family transcriptional regulator